MNPISKHKGLNLIELMVVISIVGILASIGYPLYTEQMERTRRADGKTKLMEILEAQERFYSANNTYITTMTSLGYPAGTVFSEEGYYQMSCTACATIALTQCVNLTATPVVGGSQDGDAAMSIDSRNNKTPASHW